MSLVALILLSGLAAVCSHFISKSVLKRAEELSKRVNPLAQAGRAVWAAVWSLVRTVSLFVFLGSAALWLWLAYATRGGQDVASLTSSLNAIVFIREKIELLDKTFSVALLSLAIIVALIHVRGSARKRFDEAIEAATRRQYRELKAKRESGQPLEPMSPTPSMERLLAEMQSVLALIRDKGKESPEAEGLNRQLHELEARYEHEDLSRRIRAEVTQEDYPKSHLPKPLDRVMRFLMSEPLFRGLARSGRLVYLAGLLLLVPTLLRLEAGYAQQANLDLMGLYVDAVREKSEHQFLPAAEPAELSPQERNQILQYARVLETRTFKRFIKNQDQSDDYGLRAAIVRAELMRQASAKLADLVFESHIDGFGDKGSGDWPPPPPSSGAPPNGNQASPGTEEPRGAGATEHVAAEPPPPSDLSRSYAAVSAERLSSPEPTTNAFKGFAQKLSERAERSKSYKEALFGVIGRESAMVDWREVTWNIPNYLIAVLADFQLEGGPGTISGFEAELAKGQIEEHIAATQEKVLESIWAEYVAKNPGANQADAEPIVGPPDAGTPLDEQAVTTTLNAGADIVRNSVEPKLVQETAVLREKPDLSRDEVAASEALDAYAQKRVKEAASDSRAAEVYRSAETYADALRRYDDVFPPDDSKRTDSAYGKLVELWRTRANKPDRIFAVKKGNDPVHQARDVDALRSMTDVGGIVFGEALPSPALGQIADLRWSEVGNGNIKLECLDAGGQVTAESNVSSELAFQALTYAADGRKLAVTIVNAQPLKARRVLANPILFGTRLGADLVELDKHIFDAIDKTNPEDLKEALKNPEILDETYLLANEAREVRLEMNLLTDGLSRVQSNREIVTSNIGVLQSGRYEGTQQEIADKLADQKGKLADLNKAEGELRKRQQELDPAERAVVRALAKMDLAALRRALDSESLFRDRPQFYQEDLAKSIGNCAHSADDADGFAGCIDSSIGKFEDIQNSAENGWERLMELSRAPAFGEYSCITDHQTLPAALGDWQWPNSPSVFQMELQVKFSGVDTDKKKPTPPYVLKATTSRLRDLVRDWVSRDASKVAGFERVAQFSVLQRLFRAVLDGQVSPRFPVERLAQLCQAISGTQITAARTPIWDTASGWRTRDVNMRRAAAALGLRSQ